MAGLTMYQIGRQPGHLTGQLVGQVLRGCERELIHRQYHCPGSDLSLTPGLRHAFSFTELCVQMHPERRIIIDPGASRPPLILYSDAEWHGEGAMVPVPPRAARDGALLGRELARESAAHDIASSNRTAGGGGNSECIF